MCSGASTEHRSESSHLVPLAMSTNMLIERTIISESKSQRNLASQFGTSVGVVGNILKKKRE